MSYIAAMCAAIAVHAAVDAFMSYVQPPPKNFTHSRAFDAVLFSVLAVAAYIGTV
jgi:hypothetical protein